MCKLNLEDTTDTFSALNDVLTALKDVLNELYNDEDKKTCKCEHCKKNLYYDNLSEEDEKFFKDISNMGLKETSKKENVKEESVDEETKKVVDRLYKMTEYDKIVSEQEKINRGEKKLLCDSPVDTKKMKKSFKTSNMITASELKGLETENDYLDDIAKILIDEMYASIFDELEKDEDSIKVESIAKILIEEMYVSILDEHKKGGDTVKVESIEKFKACQTLSESDLETLMDIVVEHFEEQGYDVSYTYVQDGGKVLDTSITVRW